MQSNFTVVFDSLLWNIFLGTETSTQNVESISTGKPEEILKEDNDIHFELHINAENNQLHGKNNINFEKKIAYLE